MHQNVHSLRIARQIGMYGSCKDVAAYVRDHQLGDAHYDHLGSQWLVSTFSPVVSRAVPVTTTRAAALEQVEQIFQRKYEADFALQVAA